MRKGNSSLGYFDLNGKTITPYNLKHYLRITTNITSSGGSPHSEVKLSKATPLRSTLPVLSCVLIKATNEKTTLIATDLELTIKINLSVGQ